MPGRTYYYETRHWRPPESLWAASQNLYVQAVERRGHHLGSGVPVRRRNRRMDAHLDGWRAYLLLRGRFSRSIWSVDAQPFAAVLAGLEGDTRLDVLIMASMVEQFIKILGCRRRRTARSDRV